MAPYPLVDRVNEILRLADGRRVLHLGCTNWPYTAETLAAGTLLHPRIQAVASELVGVDADPEGARALEAAGLGPVLVADAEDLGSILDDPLVADGFDLIVAAEIIEHLNNPGLMLGALPRLLRPDGRLVITTINAYGALRFVPYALRGKGGRQEPVHPDHVAYYSPSTLGLLVRRHDYDVDGIAFYRLAAEHRRHAAWWIRASNDVATRLAPQLSDGLVLVARPHNRPGRNPGQEGFQNVP